MKHPDEGALALFAGHDLNSIIEWRIGRHVAQCEQCRGTVDAFVAQRSETAGLGELPPGVAWNRLASEMKANIRLGLAAGECVSGPAQAADRAGFTGLHTLLAYAAVILLVVAGVWLQRPVPVENGRAVLAATGDGIQLTEGGRSLGLRYGASRNVKDVSYSADAKGAMSARYIDSSTGYVTVVNVNME
jgi:hypothetical protein